MSQGKLKIHTENLLPIIKKWLYSEKEIFIRELISNACDAIEKLRILSSSEGFEFDRSKMKIEVAIDKEKKTLTFTDTGLGMDAGEVEKYIAQLAFSGAEEFSKKYSKEDGIIGHFGLGFYSTYMVAKLVTINTLSYKTGSEPVLWSCDGSTDYTLEKGTKGSVGTSITLHLDAENEEFLDEGKINGLLERFCAFLPYPVFLGEKQISSEPLWIKNPSECTEEQYLDFYRKLYPMEPDPVFWVHLNIDAPFTMKGILYFPKITNRFDWNQSKTKLYCNRVFVSDECKELMPEFLTSLRGVLDSPDIPLNVSRSYLQVDSTVRKLKGHIASKIAARLSALHLNENEKFLAIWKEIELVVKLGVLHDDKFYEKVEKILVWESSNGGFTTAQEYLERNREKTDGKIYYTGDLKQENQLLSLYKEKGIEVIVAGGQLDASVMSQLERKLEKTQFKRIDDGVNDLLANAENSENEPLKAFFKEKLEGIEVDAKPLNNESCPAVILIDEQSRRMRDYFMMSNPEMANAFPEKRTLLLNSSSPLVQAISKMEDSELAKELTKQVYELALLSQKELRPEQLGDFVTRSSKLLEKLVLGKELQPSG